ncbi:MAG: hypothetical protein RR959_06085 [Erysipelotrichaceae bacterium]
MRQQRIGRKEIPMSEDVKELLARNKAYKVTLEHCNETCNDVDNLFNATYVHISRACVLTDQQREIIMKELTSLSIQVKEQGTRKLRQAFVDYVLTTGCSKLEQQRKG